VRRARELVTSGATTESTLAMTITTMTTVVMLLSTLPSVRVRWTTRTAVSGDAWMDCVSSTFCRFLTPDTMRSTVCRMTTRRIKRSRRPPTM
jgi:hypothetical protein